MIALICFIWSVSTAPFKSRSWLKLENAVLHHQVVVLQRKVRGRIELTNRDRLFYILAPVHRVVQSIGAITQDLLSAAYVCRKPHPH